LIEQHAPEELAQLFDLDLPESAGGKPVLLDVVRNVLKYSVNTWDRGFMDKLYGSTNAVSIYFSVELQTITSH
jgi:glutamate decarboxylase